MANINVKMMLSRIKLSDVSVGAIILANHLMCPMQGRMSVVKVNELQTFLAEDPYEKTHAIIVNDLINPNQPLIIPLMLKGVTSYFPSRRPRASDY